MQTWITEAVTSWLVPHMLGAPRAFLFVIYYGMVLLSLVSVSALRAKLVFYLANGAYDTDPLSVAQCWHATRGVAARLFVAFFAIEALGLLIELGAVLLLYHYFVPLGIDRLVRSLMRATGADGNYLAHAVPQAIVFVIEDAPFLMFQYALGVVAYRRLFAGRDGGIARVFD